MPSCHGDMPVVDASACSARTARVRGRLLVLVVMLLAPGSGAGQSLHEAGIELVSRFVSNSGEAIQILSPGHGSERCGINGAVLATEAERAFRRDGLAARHVESWVPGPVLTIDVAALPVRSLCAVFLEFKLIVATPSGSGVAPQLAADGGRLMVSATGAHAYRARAEVEETVTVIANAIRRSRDTSVLARK